MRKSKKPSESGTNLKSKKNKKSRIENILDGKVHDKLTIFSHLAHELATEFEIAMEEEGINQTKLAELAGVKPPYVTRVMRGRQNITLETIAKFLEALNRDMERPKLFKPGVHSEDQMLTESVEMTDQNIADHPPEFPGLYRARTGVPEIFREYVVIPRTNVTSGGGAGTATESAIDFGQTPEMNDRSIEWRSNLQ